MDNTLSHDKQFETKLALLQEILNKKKDALSAILNISENQENLYNQPPGEERREFLMGMGRLKQAQIDEVIACDEVFQRIFDGLSAEFEEKSAEYKEQIQKMQDSIKEVLELDVKIRAQEEKSRAKVKESYGLPAKENVIITANKNYILEQYKANSKNKPK